MQGSLTAGALLSAQMAGAADAKKSNSARFKLRYAPGFGSFRHHAGNKWEDRLKFMADQGFRAMFDNGLMGKPADMQVAIGKLMAKLDMIIGPFVAYADFSKESMVLDNANIRAMLIDRVKKAVETAKRANVRCALMVPGRYNQRMEWDYQTANVVENLKHCADVAQKGGVTIVLEPLNPHDHPGLFLTKMPQAYQICKAVGSPACKIVDDVYHQQITEGHLISNIRRSWSEIGSFHLGDNPGRREPLTGEINFKNIFKYIHSKGYDGALCMEHGISQGGKEGEQKLIDAYRYCDNF